MSLGSKIIQAMKGKGVSLEVLARALSSPPTTIGRYKRDEVIPSIEVATKIVKVLDVSLDYLTENFTVNRLKNKNLLKRFNSIINLEDKDREPILFTLDALIGDAKERSAFGI